MLVLTRKKGEAIMLSDNIEIKVLDIDGEQIKLGIEAPNNIEINRKEIYLMIQEENRKAAEHRVPKEIFELFNKNINK